ncbi:hypothetical protein KAX02_07990 [candidate division WOR-3 bacterium]|nr:hypothetical protein [candidate division WOR-3 bacterium]
MKIKEAIDIIGRSRHEYIMIKCLKHENGLTYKELYVEYCKICKKDNITPLVYTSMYGVIRLAVARDIVIRERIVIPGKRGSQTCIWLVR